MSEVCPHFIFFSKQLTTNEQHSSKVLHDVIMEHNTPTENTKSLHNVYSDDEMATEYPLFASLNKAGMSDGLYISNLLEAESIRHCMVGDIALYAIGADTVIGHTMVVVADDQLAAAGALVLATGLVDEAPCTYFDHSSRGEALPGFGYAVKDTEPKATSGDILIMPASFWHFDLEPNNYAHNTVLIPDPRCRLPNKVHFAHALIHTIADKTIRREALLMAYLKSTLFTYMYFLPRSFVGLLPPEDQMFLDLIDKVMLPSARRKVSIEWAKIRRGETTVDEARTRIPRKDLEFAKFKAEYQAKVKAAEASKSEGETLPSPTKGKENGVLSVVRTGGAENQLETQPQKETPALAGKATDTPVAVGAGHVENQTATADAISSSDAQE